MNRFNSIWLPLCLSIGLSSCMPIGGDAEEGVGACDATQGDGTWSARTSESVTLVDRGETLASLKVLGGLAESGFSSEGGRIQLQLRLDDASGNAIYEGLSVDTFSVETSSLSFELASSFVAGAAQPVDEASVDGLEVTPPEGDLPSVVLLFDSSGSTARTDKERLRVTAAKAFVQVLPSDSTVAVMDFGVAKDLFDSVVSDCFEVSRFLLDFTTDREEITSSIDRVTAAGGTPLYGALRDALLLAEGAKRQGAGVIDVVVFTDGQAGDYSKGDADGVIRRAKAASLKLHTVALSIIDEDDDDDRQIDFANLQRLSSETNGVAVTASGPNELKGHFEGIASSTSNEPQLRLALLVSPESPLTVGAWTLNGTLNAQHGGEAVSAPFTITFEVQ
jgi:hypothetical protein